MYKTKQTKMCQLITSSKTKIGCIEYGKVLPVWPFI